MTSNERTIAEAICNEYNCEIVTEGRNTDVVQCRDGKPISESTMIAISERLMNVSINVESWQWR